LSKIEKETVQSNNSEGGDRMKQLMIGLFGFGKTGSIVAQEIIKDETLRLCWVIRKSDSNEGEYASRLLGFNHDEEKYIQPGISI
jgi:hypothetical protein